MSYFEQDPREQLRLVDDGFIYRGKLLQFHDIMHVYFKRVHVTQSLNFSKVGEYERCELALTLHDGENLSLRVNEGGFVMGLRYNRADRIRFLTNFYTICSRETFDTRLRYYMEHVKYNGYFTYEKCQFYLGNKIVIGANHFPINESDFSLCNGSILLKHKRPSFGLLARNIMIGQPQFDTYLDRDIIFYILKRHFDVSWS